MLIVEALFLFIKAACVKAITTLLFVYIDWSRVKSLVNLMQYPKWAQAISKKGDPTSFFVDIMPSCCIVVIIAYFYTLNYYLSLSAPFSTIAHSPWPISHIYLLIGWICAHTFYHIKITNLNLIILTVSNQGSLS